MAIKNNSIPLLGKQILPKLYSKIIENKVNTIYIALDDDAYDSSLKMIKDFINNGIDVYFVNLQNGDPSDIGYHKMISELSSSKQVNFKELMRMKIYGRV